MVLNVKEVLGIEASLTVRQYTALASKLVNYASGEQHEPYIVAGKHLEYEPADELSMKQAKQFAEWFYDDFGVPVSVRKYNGKVVLAIRLSDCYKLS